MALNAKKALAASKSYTDEIVLGGGALKGKNCVINSITDIAATSQKPAGKRVTFGWTLDDGTAQTGTMDVYNGEDGQGIDRMYVNAEGHLVVVYDDGTEEDVGEITIPSFQADWDETDPEENSFIKNKPLLGTASGMDIPESGDASNGQVVLGNDSRLTDARNAADVYNWAKAENPPTYTKSDVGLGNVDNTSDANKPVSTAQQTALDAKTDLTNISDVEATTTASKAYTTGEYLIYGGVLYKVTSDIASGGTITTSGVSANVTAVKVTDEMGHGGSGGTTDYSDLTNKPSINNVTLSGNKTASDLGLATPSDIVQSDWNESDDTSKAYIANKPTIPAAQEQADWNEADSTDPAYIKNKPTLGTAAAKDSTNAVTQSSTDLVESGAVYTALSGKVNTHSTDGVPDRLMTAAEGTKLSGVALGAQVNTIESISLNGSEVTPDANKNVALTVMTNAVNDLVNYYLKSETYTKTEVDTLIGAVTGINFEVVSQLPTTDISTTTIYLVPSADPGTQNIKDEYICLDTTTTPATWELIGSTDIDLSGYVTTSDLNTALADYVLTSTFNTHTATKGDSGVQGHVSLYQGDVSNKTYAQGEAAASAHTHDTRYAPYSVVADISGKADKVQNATNGNLAGLDGSGNLTDSGVAVSNVVTDVSGKADKVSSPTSGDFAGLDSNGNLTDSGKKASDFTGKSFDGTAQEWAALSAAQKAEYADGLVLIKNDTANAMLVDSAPTENSNNLVKSGGVYTALQSKAGVSDLDDKCDLTNIARVFSTSTTYTVGSWVIYEGQLYKCTTQHSGAWNASHFSDYRVDQLIPDDILSLYGRRSSISTSGTSPGKSSISAGGYSFSAFEFDTEYTVYGNEYALYNGLRYIDFDVIMGNDVYRNYKYYDASPYEAEYQSLNEPSYPFFFVVIDPEGYPFAIKMYDINIAAGTFKMKISYLNGYYRNAGEIYLAINSFERT